MKMNYFSFPSAKAKGFTMLELLVAMSVTVILLGMVTFMTGVSMDGYKDSREKVLGGRHAKEALEAITQDFEAMIARADGSDNMWLYAAVEPKLNGDVVGNTTLAGPANKKITNAARLIFFTGAPDRYDGDFGGSGDKGGDVSAVNYRLAYRDQISGVAANEVGDFPSFTLYRHIVDPDVAFANVQGTPDLSSNNMFDDNVAFMAENVLSQNIYELTVTFIIEVRLVASSDPTDKIAYLVRATINDDNVSELAILGNGISWDGTIRLPESRFIEPTTGVVTFTDNDFLNGYTITPNIIDEGQLVGVEIGMTVLSDRGLVMTQKGGMSRQDIIKEYGTHYTDTISVPRF